MPEVSLANAHDPKVIKQVTLDGSVSIKSVFAAAREHLRMPTTKIVYNKVGKEIESDEELRNYIEPEEKARDADLNPHVVYVSNGTTIETSSTDVRICMLGGGSVGKSAITLRFIQGEFVTAYDPTIQDSFVKECEVDGSTANLDILDTAGQDDFKTLRTQWMRDKEVLIFVFDITKESSFEELNVEFYEHMCEVYEGETKPVLILVGNKVDLDNVEVLKSEETKREYNRRVSKAEATARAKEWGAHYFECSALEGFNIAQVFAAGVREAISRVIPKEEPIPDDSGGCCLIL